MLLKKQLLVSEVLTPETMLGVIGGAGIVRRSEMFDILKNRGRLGFPRHGNSSWLVY